LLEVDLARGRGWEGLMFCWVVGVLEAEEEKEEGDFELLLEEEDPERATFLTRTALKVPSMSSAIKYLPFSSNIELLPLMFLPMRYFSTLFFMLLFQWFLIALSVLREQSEIVRIFYEPNEMGVCGWVSLVVDVANCSHFAGF